MHKCENEMLLNGLKMAFISFEDNIMNNAVLDYYLKKNSQVLRPKKIYLVA